MKPNAPKNPVEPDREAGLVAAAKAGDLRAFLELVRAYQRPAYRLAYAVTRDPADAAWLTQEAFARAWGEIQTLSEEDPFYPWLLGLVRVARTSVPVGIQGARRAVDPSSAGGALPHAVPSVDRSDRTRILAAFGTLETEEQMALALRAVDRAAYDEIAALLGWSLSTVVRRVSQARALLLAGADPPSGITA